MRKWESLAEINIDQTLVVAAPGVGIDSTFLGKMTAFKEELSQQASVKNITVFTSIPKAVGWNGVVHHSLVGTDESPTETISRYWSRLSILLKTYILKLIASVVVFSKDFWL